MANTDHKKLFSGTIVITLGILALRPPEVNTCVEFEQKNQFQNTLKKAHVEQNSAVNNKLNRTRDKKDKFRTPWPNNNKKPTSAATISHVSHHLWFGKKGEYWNKPFGNLLRLYFAQKNIDFNLIKSFTEFLFQQNVLNFPKNLYLTFRQSK